MARQILGSHSTGILQTTLTTFLSSANKREMLRRNRSRLYLEALQRLDAGGALTDPVDRQSLLDAIQEEFPQPETVPLGWVAKCHLGVPFEVHTLDPLGGIARHYRWGETLPPQLDRARALARSGRYLVIEVYPEKLVAVGEDGATSVLTL